MENEVIFPIIASFITLIATKVFDAFMASRKQRIDSVVQSLSAVDEITTAASDTIKYLKEERDAARSECERHKNSSETKDDMIRALQNKSAAKDRIIQELSKRLEKYEPPLPSE